MKNQLAIEKQKAYKKGYNEGFLDGERFGGQREIDEVCISLHRLGWGYKKLMELIKLAKLVDKEYTKAFYRNMEQDIYQQRMDDELQDACKDYMQITPFEKRYPEIKTLGYDKVDAKYFAGGEKCPIPMPTKLEP